jgi:hypothetical protein
MSGSRVAPPAAQPQRPQCAKRWTPRRSAGEAYDRAGLSKHVANAHGIDVSGGTRYRQGVAYSPLAKALSILADDPRTTAFPALTEAYCIVTRAQIEALPTPALLARRAELELTEADIARDLFHARMTGEGMRDLRARQHDVVLELLAIETVLEERGER